MNSIKRHGCSHRRWWLSVVMGLLLAVGIACILYPAVGSYINDCQFDDAITRYDDAVSTMSDEDRQSMLAAACQYNESLAGDPVHDPFVVGSGYAVPANYNDILNVDGKGLIGYIKIPTIGVDLPIRHGTEDDVLAEGVGHIPQTSFPIGGTGTHSVITGHTGLPSKRLFTDLIRMKEGDVFTLTVLGETHAYKVDAIKVVEPDDVSLLHVDASHEYVTLLTCTPYGINSERLLVRGIPTDLPEDLNDSERPVPWVSLFVSIALFALTCITWCVIWNRRYQAKARLANVFYLK
ncbi:MAG: class C sortase [Eggerthellaceae bacterium]|nr:class C sortase [Eggerthellaceae bacterium]MCH4221319.1 class C sortase [Eggerthellaceae bacterium]